MTSENIIITQIKIWKMGAAKSHEEGKKRKKVFHLDFLLQNTYSTTRTEQTQQPGFRWCGTVSREQKKRARQNCEPAQKENCKVTAFPLTAFSSTSAKIDADHGWAEVVPTTFQTQDGRILAYPIPPNTCSLRPVNQGPFLLFQHSVMGAHPGIRASREENKK